MHRLAIGISFGLVFATVALPAAAETARQVLAAPAGQRVYDLAKVLPQADRARLRTRLQQMAKSGSGNGAIVIVQQVEGESIETFAKRIGNKWKLGGTSQKKGFVIVTAIGQRRWRFETNRALRAQIPDDEAKRLMQQNLVPAFRRKQYGKGLNAALIAIDAASRRPVSRPAAATAIATQSLPPSQPGLILNDPLSGAFGLLAAFVIVLLGIPVFLALIGLGLTGSRWTGTHGCNNWWHSHHHGSSWSSHSSHSSDSFSGGGGGDSGGGGDGGGGASGGW